MAQSRRTLTTVENAVLRKVRQRECRPLDLMESLSKSGYSSAELKLALAYLLHGRQIELTPTRILRQRVLRAGA